MIVKTDCSHFKGDIPCKPHKEHKVHCEECNYYQRISQNILVIKLGAIGDVIRTTPLLRKIRQENSNVYIYWLSYTPDILSNNWINRILSPTTENIELLKNIEFDWLINLDKDPIAISLTHSIKAKRKSGFTIDNFGHAKPIGTDAENHKWLTGLFDDVNKENKKNYMKEIFEICGYEFNGEEYILDVHENDSKFDIDKNKKVIGLNTGCGGKWTSRLWPTEYWIELAKKLLQENYEVILLGGEQEDEKNKFIQKESGAKYFGHFSLQVFINLMNNCDLVVTAVTMGMHLAIGLKKKLVLFNNIFNRNEFYLYGRGEILEPDFDCNCYYTPTCENNCMQYLYPNKVLDSIKVLI
ncbi:MAG: glycosyltransferase family 9 protein [Bacteroidota bacterium]